jgi:hypothetical protein
LTISAAPVSKASYDVCAMTRPRRSPCRKMHLCAIFSCQRCVQGPSSTSNAVHRRDGIRDRLCSMEEGGSLGFGSSFTQRILVCAHRG